LDDQYRDDPNQPLFILDGFETSLQRIVDLDPNRIESVTILKDAASTAFFGSRAANGVILVTTIKGEPGRFQVFYTSDFLMQIPNLRSYNMMNAWEKLEFERRSGRYTYNDNLNTWPAAEIQNRLDSLYNVRLADVARGVNTDWMSKPLRVPLQQRQSIRFSGGTDVLMVNAGISYRSAPGVMKGSGRNSWSANLGLTFNTRNLAFINQLELNGFTATESPWGNFSDWVNMNPYFRPVDSNGEPPRYLDRVMNNAGFGATIGNVVNPLYVATRLNLLNQQRNTTIDERFNIRWNFRENMRLEGLFQLNYLHSNRVIFTPPEHPQFDEVEEARKGTYSNRTDQGLSYTTNLMYVYSNRIDKHSYVFNTRGEITSRDNTAITWMATGFPPGTNGFPSFANNFVDGRPAFSNPVTRGANFLASLNYSYASRYLLDLTYRYDGSSIFGTAKRFTPFWSAGLGWNLHEEDFMRRYRHINVLRVSATMGELGNQNLASANSSSVYGYQLGGNMFGPGVFVNAIGNPNIEWQKTRTTNLALQLDMLDRRWVSKFEIYEKFTNPLMVNVDQAPSTGMKRYPMSLGSLTERGFEFDIAYQIIRSRNFNWRFRIFGSSARSFFDGFDGRIEGMNIAAQNSGALRRFRDGYNFNTIWAVRSLGIDPATGREVFLTRDGAPTFRYDPLDIVAVGETRPIVQGNINNNVTLFRQMTITASFRYAVRREIANTTLWTRVENISMRQVSNNQDRRALYDRWQQPGDISQFRSINLIGVNDVPVLSDRFVQTENFLALDLISFGWRCRPDGWIKNYGMSRLDFTATIAGTSGVFRLSNIQLERGTSFPEATTITLSINAAF
jgi:TonB-linked SusC/RagA family outer membrane protein